MKINNVYTALLVLLFVGCNHENSDVPETPSGTYPEDGVIRITTSVNGALPSRAGTDMTTFTGTEFQLFIDPVDAGNVYANYHYQLTVKKNSGTGEWDKVSGTFGSSGSTKPLDSETLLWAGPDVQTNVKAYANYTSNPSLLDQATADKSNTVDLLYFYNSLKPETGLTNDQELAVEFTHRLSRLNIILQFGSEFNKVGKDHTMDQNLIKSVGVFEMKNTYSFDVGQTPGTGTDGKYIYPEPVALGSIHLLTDLEVDLSGIPHITPFVSEAFKQGTIPTLTYTALVVPQTVAEKRHLVIIEMYPMNSDGTANTVGNVRNYIYTVPDSEPITFESGKAYNLTLTVGKDQITDGMLTIKGWEKGDDDTTITD